MTLTPHRPFGALVSLWIACLLPAISQAAAWDLSSQVRLTGRSNDNPTLRIEDPAGGGPAPQEIVTATSLNGSAEFDVIRATPNSRIEITPRVSRSYYPDKDFKELENTNWFIFADGSWRRQRTNWNLGLRYEDVSLLSSEDRGGEGTGGSLFRVDDTRSRFTISPSASWIISELDQIQVGASYSEVDYALDFTGRANSESTSASLSYQRALTPRQSVGLSMFTSRSESEQQLNENDPFTVNNNFDALNLNASYTYNIAEDFQWSARYGRQETDSTIDGQRIQATVLSDEFVAAFGDCSAILDVGDVAPTPSNPAGGDIFQFVDCKRSLKSNTYAFDVRKSFELSQIGLGLTQSITPNSAGSPTERIEIRFDYEREFSEKLSMDLELSAYEQQTVNLSNIARKNENIRAEIGVDYVFDRNWAVGAQYIYRSRDDTTEGVINPDNLSFGSRDSNEFGFYIRYFIERSEL